MVKHRSPKPRFRVRLAAGPQINEQSEYNFPGFLSDTKRSWACRTCRNNPPLGGLFLRFLVSRALHAPLAKLLELDFALNFLFVFLAPVVRTLANGAGEFD